MAGGDTVPELYDSRHPPGSACRRKRNGCIGDDAEEITQRTGRIRHCRNHPDGMGEILLLNQPTEPTWIEVAYFGTGGAMTLLAGLSAKRNSEVQRREHINKT